MQPLPTPERSARMLVAQGCIIVVVLASLAGIFIHSAAIGLTAVLVGLAYCCSRP